MKRILLLTMFVCTAALAADGQPAEAPAMNDSAVKTEFRYSTTSKGLKVEYTLTNGSAEPILVFDRIWDLEAERLNRDWALVRFEGGTAVVSRTQVSVPARAIVEQPPTPYGRVIAAGAKASGSFVLPLPLKEQGPYDKLLKKSAARTAKLDGLQLKLAWGPRADFEALLNGRAPAEIGGEKLFLLPNRELGKKQKIASSAVQSAALEGLAYSK
jgi:hypothetical protein